MCFATSTSDHFLYSQHGKQAHHQSAIEEAWTSQRVLTGQSAKVTA